jgi:hypothetical protein
VSQGRRSKIVVLICRQHHLKKSPQDPKHATSKKCRKFDVQVSGLGEKMRKNDRNIPKKGKKTTAPTDSHMVTH